MSLTACSTLHTIQRIQLGSMGCLDLDLIRVPAADAAQAYAALAAGGLPLTGLICYPGKDT